MEHKSFPQVQILLDGKGGGRQRESVTEPAENAEQITWSHFDVADEDANAWWMSQEAIQESIREAMLAEETRPRSLLAENGLFVVLRGVNTNPGQDPEDMVSIRIWLEPRRIVSCYRRRLLSIEDVILSITNRQGPVSTGDFLNQVVGRLADRIGDFVSGIEDRLSEAEDNVQAGDYEGQRKQLGQLRREIAQVRRFLAPQRDALDRLYRSPIQFIPASESNGLREEADRLTRYLEDLDLARERAVVLQEEFLSLLAQEQNNRMYVLAIVAAIFLPLSFITGLFGMNLGGLPGMESPTGFTIATAVMLVIAIGVIIYLRSKKWF